MDGPPASALAALDIMRQWQWSGGDPDGNIWPVSMELSLVINRLAMEGIVRPQNVVLSLLCQGELLANGDYRWRKYQGGNHFQLEETGAPIKAKQWQVLADLIEWERKELQSGAFLLDDVVLAKLGHESCYPYEWGFTHNRFDTSLCPPDTPFHDAAYFEEWYSAWDIEVSPVCVGVDFPDSDTEPVAPALNKGGRPPVADWELAALEIAGRYYRGDFKPQTIADVARELATWLGTQDLHPSDSVVRIHAKRIFDAFQIWESE